MVGTTWKRAMTEPRKTYRTYPVKFEFFFFKFAFTPDVCRYTLPPTALFNRARSRSVHYENHVFSSLKKKNKQTLTNKKNERIRVRYGLKRDVIYLFFVWNIRHVFQTRTSSARTYCFREGFRKTRRHDPAVVFAFLRGECSAIPGCRERAHAFGAFVPLSSICSQLFAPIFSGKI